jgi:hypothetical protein
MTHIFGFERSQLLLLPETVDDYIGADNPVRFIDAFVDQLDLAAARAVPRQSRECLPAGGLGFGDAEVGQNGLRSETRLPSRDYISFMRSISAIAFCRRSSSTLSRSFGGSLCKALTSI